MRIRTSDGHTHPAIVTSRHPAAGPGRPILVLTDTREVIDSFGWTFCQLVTSTEMERRTLRDAGYHC
ncbi:MAG: hypothetical protein ACYDCO_14370 [Armatimonadota bacterium]